MANQGAVPDLMNACEADIRVSIRLVDKVPEEAEFMREYKAVPPSRRQEWLRRRILLGHSLVKRGEDHLLVPAAPIEAKPAADAAPNKSAIKNALGGVFAGGEKA